MEAMKEYLSKSIASLNRNKLNGLLAEIDFRNYLSGLGFSDRVSPGGWIARSTGADEFGRHTAVLFPEPVQPDRDYPPGRNLSPPPLGLHTVCATFHQLGIASYFCTPVIERRDDDGSISWYFIQLGLPSTQSYREFPSDLPGFSERQRKYNFLRYRTDTSVIPQSAIPEEFAKEHLRVTFQNRFMSEVSDIDGIFWGQQYTYPVEIKEKTAGRENDMGEYFGLDAGPFVKLAFYAAKRGNLHSLFVVREITDAESRALAGWWFIKFDQLAQYASWVPRRGGRNMMGGVSSVIRIPKAQFQELNAENLDIL